MTDAPRFPDRADDLPPRHDDGRFVSSASDGSEADVSALPSGPGQTSGWTPDPTVPEAGPRAMVDHDDPSFADVDCDCDGHGAMPSGLAEGLPVFDESPMAAPSMAGPTQSDDEASDEDEESVGSSRGVSRRRFIQGAAAAGALGYVMFRGAKPVDRSTIESQVGGRSASTGNQGPVPADAQLQVAAPNPDANLDEIGGGEEDDALLAAAPIDQRVLVLIEFAGGNDGLSMVVPYGSSVYYDQRPNLAIAPEDVLVLDDQVGLAPGLARLHQRQMATVEGVGPVDGSLSHFEMVDRWAQGDLLGTGGQRAGFLARLSDAVDVGGAVTGLSVAGHTPRLEASRSSTLALNDFNQLRVLTDDDWIYPRYRNALRAFGGGPMSTTISQSWTQLFAVGDAMNSDIERIDGNSPMVQNGGRLGRQLAMAAELIKANVGVRVVHAQLGGFDTHNGHVGRHNNLMEQFDGAVAGFMQDLEAAGVADRVLVATTSEFGRRVRQNGSGLDHGSASSMLLVGPIKPGRLGEPSPLNDLDRNDNLRTTLPFDRYLASLAQEWLGVESGIVLPDSPQPFGIF